MHNLFTNFLMLFAAWTHTFTLESTYRDLVKDNLINLKDFDGSRLWRR